MPDSVQEEGNSSICVCICTFKISRVGRQKNGGDLQLPENRTGKTGNPGRGNRLHKLEKECGEKKFSKTELIKKPFHAKRKLLSGILNCADAAIEKTKQLAADVKQYQTDKAE